MVGLFGIQTSYLTQEDITSLIEETYTVLGAEIASIRWLEDNTCAIEYVRGPQYAGFEALFKSRDEELRPATENIPQDRRAAIARKKSSLKTTVSSVSGDELVESITKTGGSVVQEDPTFKFEPKWNDQSKFIIHPDMGPGPTPYVPDASVVEKHARAKIKELQDRADEGVSLGIHFGNYQDYVGWEQLTCYNYGSQEWRIKSNGERVAALLAMCVEENPNVRIQRQDTKGRPSIAVGLSAAQTERNLHQMLDETNDGMQQRAAALRVIKKVHKYKEIHGPISSRSNISTTLSKKSIAKERGVPYRTLHKFKVEGKSISEDA